VLSTSLALNLAKPMSAKSVVAAVVAKSVSYVSSTAFVPIEFTAVTVPVTTPVVAVLVAKLPPLTPCK
jgi:hypothetical protein